MVNLFPHLAHVLQTQTPWLWDEFFPESTLRLCPETTYNLDLQRHLGIAPEHHSTVIGALGYDEADASNGVILPVRGPVLLIIELMGIFLGLQGFLMLESDRWAWRRAFLFYAGMNIAAIFCHNLTEPLSRQHAWAWSFDVAFTGSSSFCLILAALTQPFPIVGVPVPKSSIKWLSVVGPIIIFTLSILGLAIDGVAPVPFTAEVLYLLITILAAVFLSTYVVVPAFNSSVGRPTGAGTRTVIVPTSLGRYSLLAAGVGGLGLALAGLPLDRMVCELAVNSGMSTEIGLPHFVFIGCVIAFQGLLVYVLLGCKQQSELFSKKKQ